MLSPGDSVRIQVVKSDVRADRAYSGNMTPPARRIVIVSTLIVASGISGFLFWGRAEARRARALNCASSIVSICFAGRRWAEEHEGYFPTSFVVMSNEVFTPKILCCIPERRVASWSEFTPFNTTYEILTPGVHKTNINAVFIRCVVHGCLGYANMTVFDGKRRRGKFD